MSIFLLLGYYRIVGSPPGFEIPNLISVALPSLGLYFGLRKNLRAGGWWMTALFLASAGFEAIVDILYQKGWVHGAIIVMAVGLMTLLLPVKRFRITALIVIEVYVIGYFPMVSHAGIDQSGFFMILGCLIVSTLVHSLQREELELTINEKDAALLDAKRSAADALVAQSLAEERQRITEEALAARAWFLSMISHELKTPMGRLYVALQMLPAMAWEELGLTSEQVVQLQELIRPLIQDSEDVHEMLEGLLNLSRISSGRHEVKKVVVSLDELLVEARDFDEEVQRQGLELVIKCEERSVVVTDPIMVRTIIRNMISNAVKYTRAGEIRVVVLTVANYLMIQVMDTGIGMSPEVLQHIFEPFYRGEKTAMKIRGTGLGMAIVKAYTEALGGRVYVESKEGEGTSVTVRIPFLRQ